MGLLYCSLFHGCLPLKVIFHQKVVLLQRSSFTEGHLPLKVVFQQRSSSNKGPLPPKVILTVIVPNLSLLPYLEMAKYFFDIHTKQTKRTYIEAGCCKGVGVYKKFQGCFEEV